MDYNGCEHTTSDRSKGNGQVQTSATFVKEEIPPPAIWILAFVGMTIPNEIRLRTLGLGVSWQNPLSF